MSRDNMIWDSKKGWIKPRGFVIKMKIPDFTYDEKEQEKYENAPDNPEYPMRSYKAKIGFEKEPYIVALYEWIKKMTYLRRKRWILGMIPFVKVEVIE